MTSNSRFWADLSTADFAHRDMSQTVAVLPVAATEQHGPHLPLRVDTALVDGVVAGASYVGKVDGDLAEIKAKVNFEALKEGWSQIPLGTDLALAEAKTTAPEARETALGAYAPSSP